MKRVKTLTLIGLPLALAACAASIRPADVDLDPPAPSVTEECVAPVLLPERALSQAEAETFWLQDRFALVDCQKRQATLVEWVNLVIGATQEEK